MSSKKWAEFRFSVIGSLFASPPPYGKLREKLRELGQKSWKHPITGEFYKISHKTVEEWYYQAKKSNNPIDVLSSTQRSDSNISRTITSWMKDQLKNETDKHPGWSKKLHADNLTVLIKNHNQGKAPSYSSVNRYLNSIGYHRCSSNNVRRAGYQKTLEKKKKFEQRSYEHPYVGSLFHLDFHHCSREIITSNGEIIYPVLLCIIDDCSRLVCHLQWYLSESAENLVHGFIQALQKRGSSKNAYE